MCGMKLDIIILVLTPLKFPLTIRNFMRIHSYNNFIFETVTYCSLLPYCCCSSASCSATFSRMCFNHFQRHSVFSFTLLYNKEAVSFKLWSPSATVSCQECRESIVWTCKSTSHPASHVYYTFLNIQSIWIYKQKTSRMDFLYSWLCSALLY